LHAGQTVRIDAATRNLVRTSAEEYRNYVLSLSPDVYLPLESVAPDTMHATAASSNSPSTLQIHNLASSATPGTLHCAGAESPFTSGRVGKALQFRGDPFKDRVQIPFAPPQDESFTFSAWVWLEPSPPVDRFIASDYWATSRSGFGLAVNNEGRLYVVLAQMVQKVRSVPLALCDDHPIPIAAWQHVAFVADRQQNTFTLYRNGQPVAMRNGVGLLIALRAERPTLVIGASAFGLNKPEQLRCWPGKIDEVVAWRRALSPEEITRLYEEAPQ
jgi:hypothetical protein